MDRSRQRAIGVAAVVVGVVIAAFAPGRPWTSIGVGFIGGGVPAMFGLNHGRLRDGAARRRIAIVSIAGLVTIFAVIALDKLVAPRHSAWRIAGVALLTVIVIAYLVVLFRLTRRERSLERKGPE